MIPGRCADEVLDDLSLDIDQGGDLFGILTVHVRQQSLEVEVHGVPAGLSLQRLLIGHDELTQTIQHLSEDIGGDETITQYFLSPLCPHGVHLFASAHCPVDMGYCLEAIVRTICYGM